MARANFTTVWLLRIIHKIVLKHKKGDEKKVPGLVVVVLELMKHRTPAQLHFYKQIRPITGYRTRSVPGRLEPFIPRLVQAAGASIRAFTKIGAWNVLDGS